MTKPSLENYRARIAALGFSNPEVNAVEFVLIRMGFILPRCEHDVPRFVSVCTAEDEPEIHEQRWQKAMREMGFREDAIRLAEHALGLCLPDCEHCSTNCP